MYLKTLTLRGFKSFASATTLHLEPGITCVVGPNGSGKSNVVDALAWVMGEQGAKTLRGASMQDVVFAGTTGPHGRPPLGRAEVSLTIDNSDGALPLGVAEVTVSRTMFRSGGSEYAINGAPARLLDVQELLSDSGIGREMHVIVGQGQLDAVLHATPEDRRGFVEEAAGVLKHRKRKERALRKLESTGANLDRLADLSGEVRRQLGPLARQAEAARRAAVVAADVRDARSRLLADDLVAAAAELAAELADEQARAARRAAAEAELDDARASSRAATSRQEELAPRLAAAQEAYYALQGVRERLRSTLELATERERARRAQTVVPVPARDADALLADAGRAREAEASLAARVQGEGAALAAASAARAAAEAALAAHERAVADAARTRADARERLTALSGRVSARRSAASAAAAEAERADAAARAAGDRARAAGERVAELAGPAAGGAGSAGEPSSRDGEVSEGDTGRDLREAATRAAGALTDADGELTRWRAAERAAERDRAGAQARAEALELGLRERRDGTGALLDHGGHLPGVLGAFAALLAVEPGAEDVVAAALGTAGEAVAVESLEVAVDALRLLRERGAGHAEVVASVPVRRPARRGRHGAPAATGATDDGAAARAALAAQAAELSAVAGVGEAVPLLSLVSAPVHLAPVLERLLDGHLAVPGLAAARALVSAHPDLVAVTRDGDVVRAHGARGGSGGVGGGPPSRVHVAAALDDARAALAGAVAAAARARTELDAASAAREEASAGAAAASAALSAHDAAAAAGARALGEASGAQRAAEAERVRADAAAQRAGRAAHDAAGRLAEAEEALAAEVAAQDGAPDGPRDAARPEGQGPEGQGPEGQDEEGRTGEGLGAAAARARSVEVEARLALRTSEERLRGAGERAERAERAARAEAVRAEAAADRVRVAAGAVAVAAAVRAGADAALAVARQSLLSAGLRRDDIETDAAETAERVGEAAARAEAAAVALASLTDSVHRDELARVERTGRLEALRARAVEELGADPDALVAEFGPDRPVPVPGGEPDASAAPSDGRPDDPGAGDDQGAGRGVPYVRAEQEERLRRAERDLARLGRVNPLALEEYAALEERSAFLVRQLEDLRTAREDLLDIVREVDERVQEVFAAAFADTAAQFEVVFARLFPGGSGKLVLTDPDDLLTSGIEVVARPAGKRVARLSLLSGGERSLAAVALLVAIFTARPSPFYVLDEVEAALDDTNLRRLLGVLEDLRASSQLIVITHQERTMEIADALYGVSMRADGISAVVSQRLRDGAPGEPGREPVVVDLREGASAPAPRGSGS